MPGTADPAERPTMHYAKQSQLGGSVKFEVSSVKWEGPSVESSDFNLHTLRKTPYGVSRVCRAKQSQFLGSRREGTAWVTVQNKPNLPRNREQATGRREPHDRLCKTKPIRRTLDDANSLMGKGLCSPCGVCEAKPIYAAEIASLACCKVDGGSELPWVQDHVLDALTQVGVGDMDAAVFSLDHGGIGVLAGLVGSCPPN